MIQFKEIKKIKEKVGKEVKKISYKKFEENKEKYFYYNFPNQIAKSILNKSSIILDNHRIKSDFSLNKDEIQDIRAMDLIVKANVLPPSYNFKLDILDIREITILFYKQIKEMIVNYLVENGYNAMIKENHFEDDVIILNIN